MDWLRHPVLVRICQVAIGVLFALAGLSKLGDLGSFVAEVHHFRLVPAALANLVAIVLPWIEIVAALALILGVRARAGAVVATALLVVFTLAVGSAVARGLDIECGCFGTSDGTKVGALKLAENVGMLLLAAVGSLRPRRAG